MKRNSVEQFLKKLSKTSLVLFLSVATSLGVTACSMQFSADKVPDNLIKAEEAVVGSITESLGDEISTADLMDNKTLDDLENTIQAAADSFKRMEDIEFEKATLLRVVDGDTIVVELGNEQKKVRLIGIDTPEAVASKEYLQKTGKKNTSEGKESSAFTKALLSNVKEVYLEKDVSDTDRYDRLLRYVWLEIPDREITPKEIASKMVNGIILLNNNYSKAKDYEPDTKYSEEFHAIDDYSDTHEDSIEGIFKEIAKPYEYER